MTNAPSRPIPTTCAYCGVGCGILATRDHKGGVSIEGDPEHPANFGRLCSKGAALGETLGLEGRLLHPMIRLRDGRFVQVAWDDALDHLADGLSRIIALDGSDAVAFYLSGQLLTEDYYVANKLMKGFIGSANVDTNSRLCMASSVAGHKRAFGSDTVPGSYEDLDLADLIVLTGSNTAWCHPVLFQRMLRNKQERGARIVVIDPRRTATAEEADLFLGLKPGTDTALFSGLLVHLADCHAVNRTYMAAHTVGFDAALARAREIAGSVSATALATGLAEADVSAFFNLFRSTPAAVTAFSQGVNQSAQGTDKVNAILNCHLATGRIGKPGAGPLSLTGQPNAMGGREVGGLANQLAAHMGFDPADVDRVRRFWRAPSIARREGLKAVQMFEAIGRGAIKALWVMGTNPAVSMPDADVVRRAMSGLDLFVVSENVLTNDTVNSGAHLVLPALAWAEKDGTVTNSERRISRQRAFLQAPGEARPDWWIVSEVAKRLGFAEAFSYNSAGEIFREHAALSGFENDGRRSFDIGGLSEISDHAFDQLAPLTWPVPRDGEGTKRFFSNGGFLTVDKKGRFVPVEIPSLARGTSFARPLRLNTGRMRDQWHTMTRTGRSVRLSEHCPEPFVELHPDDAARAGIVDGGFARLTTDHGVCVLRVAVTHRQQRGLAFVPIHWSETNSASARIGALVPPAVDPISGQPEMKVTPLAIDAVAFARRGFILSRKKLKLPASVHWTRVAIEGGYGYLVADDLGDDIWKRWLEVTSEGRETLSFTGAKTFRAAVLSTGNRIDLCVATDAFAETLSWDAMKLLFEKPQLSNAERRLLLSGKHLAGASDNGPIVCACFGVGRKAITKAIEEGACSVDAIGATLQAGTNCGSCIPELKRLVAASAPKDQLRRTLNA